LEKINPSLQMAAAVSSHEDSMARMVDKSRSDFFQATANVKECF
jgi:hypothetical protein